MSIFRPLFVIAAVFSCGVFRLSAAEPATVEVSSLEELERVASANDQAIHMKPGVYRFVDYLTPERIQKIGQSIDRSGKTTRPPVPMINLKGDGNRFDFTDVVFEIDTSLYAKMPSGYLRAILFSGRHNTVNGLTVRNAGEDKGSNGNLLSVLGDDNLMENITLHVFGSSPHGYGDLLGKGGPNLVPLNKQSGFMIGGNRTTVRRCKVFSHAFGHCFYIQKADGVVVEDCYAEGHMRPTSEMLKDTSGLAFDLGFKSVYQNRDGRSEITPGYMKSLSEDGFRTYGGVSHTVIRNCIAVNTRAGFEIAGNDTDSDKTLVEGCVAKGCERSYLIGSNTIVRRSRGDVFYGPLLYLRGGRDSDVELEVSGETSNFTVHALATIAGSNHRVKFTNHSPEAKLPAIPILLGYGMPRHAEMSSPIEPAPTENITLINELDQIPVIEHAGAVSCEISSKIRKSAEKASEKVW